MITEATLVSPRVEIDPFFKNGSRVEVNINPQKCSEFLDIYGLPHERIEALDIKVPNIDGLLPLGIYDGFEHYIELYPNCLVSCYESTIKSASDFVVGLRTSKIEVFGEYLTTKRFTRYLCTSSITPDRRMKFAENTLQKSMDKYFRYALMHELVHATEDGGISVAGCIAALCSLSIKIHRSLCETSLGKYPLVKYVFKSGGVIDQALLCFYRSLPTERKANEIKKLRYDPYWRDLASFKLNSVI